MQAELPADGDIEMKRPRDNGEAEGSDSAEPAGDDDATNDNDDDDESMGSHPAEAAVAR
jgi:hypothetical protein